MEEASTTEKNLQALGIVLGLGMLGCLFIPWESHWLVQISYFLGVQTHAFERLLGLHFLPVVAMLVYVLSMLLSRLARVMKLIALIAAIMVLAVALGDLFILLSVGPQPGLGLWLVLGLSASAVVVGIVLLWRKPKQIAA